MLVDAGYPQRRVFVNPCSFPESTTGNVTYQDFTGETVRRSYVSQSITTGNIMPVLKLSSTLKTNRVLWLHWRWARADGRYGWFAASRAGALP